MTSSAAPSASAVSFEPVVHLPADEGWTSLSADEGDLNGDGRDDLVVGHDNAKVSVQLATEGGFGPRTDYDTLSAPFAVLLTDLTNDDVPDLVVANYHAHRVSISVGNGSGEFGPARHFYGGDGPWGLAAGRFNGDRNRDLAVTNYNEKSVTILLGDGAGGVIGQFGGLGVRPKVAPAHFAVGEYPASVAVGHFDKGDETDLVVGTLKEGVYVLRGSGSGGFAPATRVHTKAASSVAVGKLNGDAHEDIAVVNNQRNVSIMLGRGNGEFDPGIDVDAGVLPWSVAVDDLDGDRVDDLAVSSISQGDAAVSVLLGGHNSNGPLSQPFSFQVGHSSLSVVSGDFDGNGGRDLAVASAESPGGLGVLLNRTAWLRESHFAPYRPYPAGRSARAIAVANLDDDSLPDIAVADRAANQVAVLRGEATGGFSAPTAFGTGTRPTALLAAELSQDGRPDLVTGNYDSSDLSVLLAAGGGVFAPASPYPAEGNVQAVAAGNFDGNGNLDLASVGTYAVSVFLGTGGGAFGPASRVSAGHFPSDIATADFNNDGTDDLAVTNVTFSAGSYASVLLGDRTGGFGETTLGPRSGDNWAGEIATADLNGDKNDDVVVIQTHEIRVWLGDGAGGFGQPSSAPVDWPTAIEVADFNRDGHPDLALAVDGRGEPRVEIMLGDGQGGFGPPARFVVGSVDFPQDDPVDLAAAHLDGDGRLDLAVATHRQNESPAGIVALLLTDPPKPPPPPVVPVAMKSVVVTPTKVKDTVHVTCGRERKQRVTEPTRFPLGCLIDTKAGTATVTAASDLVGGVQHASFRGGAFRVSQVKGSLETRLKLSVAAPRLCKSKRPRDGGSVAGGGRGRWRTDGKHGWAASAQPARMATWRTVERCKGTFFKASKGTIRVRGVKERRTWTLKAPAGRLVR